MNKDLKAALITLGIISIIGTIFWLGMILPSNVLMSIFLIVGTLLIIFALFKGIRNNL